MNRSYPYADAPNLPDDAVIDPRRLLGTRDPVELEIGSARGGFLFERLEADPAAHIIALEVRRKWAKIVDDRLRARGDAKRCRVFASDARQALPRFAPCSVARVFVHFPDPWWKKRHQKRLVITADWVSEMARILVNHGECFVQTDVEERAAAYQALLDAHPGFQPCQESPRIADNPYLARSPRERRAMADGLPIVRLWYRLAI